MNTNKIPDRSEVPENDKWDLSSLFTSDSQWESSLKEIPSLTQKLLSFKGRLSESSETFLAALKAFENLNLKMETVYHYASLLQSQDPDNSDSNDKYGRAMISYTQMSSETSFFEPELQSIDEKLLAEWISKPEFADYKIFIQKFLYMKKFILSEKEERKTSHTNNFQRLHGKPEQNCPRRSVQKILQ